MSFADKRCTLFICNSNCSYKTAGGIHFNFSPQLGTLVYQQQNWTQFGAEREAFRGKDWIWLGGAVRKIQKINK